MAQTQATLFYAFSCMVRSTDPNHTICGTQLTCMAQTTAIPFLALSCREQTLETPPFAPHFMAKPQSHHLWYPVVWQRAQPYHLLPHVEWHRPHHTFCDTQLFSTDHSNSIYGNHLYCTTPSHAIFFLSCMEQTPATLFGQSVVWHRPQLSICGLMLNVIDPWNTICVT